MLTSKTLGNIVIKRTARSRQLRLSFDKQGSVRVSAPLWVGSQAILKFVNNHQDWIVKNRPSTSLIKPGTTLFDGTRIDFKPAEHVRNVKRPKERRIIVQHDALHDWSEPTVQKQAHKAAIEHLRKQAQEDLLPLTQQWADTVGAQPAEVTVKTSTSRWGSCSGAGRINLSLFLVQHPRAHQDYVIVHELIHLNHPHHQPDFWEAVAKYIPQVDETKRTMRRMRPELVLNPPA